MKDKIRHVINSSTSSTREFTNNFIAQINNKIPQIMQGEYCIVAQNPTMMIFYWAYKDELKFSVFSDNPSSDKKDKRDAMNALINAKVAETDRCNK